MNSYDLYWQQHGNSTRIWWFTYCGSWPLFCQCVFVRVWDDGNAHAWDPPEAGQPATRLSRCIRRRQIVVAVVVTRPQRNTRHDARKRGANVCVCVCLCVGAFGTGRRRSRPIQRMKSPAAPERERGGDANRPTVRPTDARPTGSDDLNSCMPHMHICAHQKRDTHMKHTGLV